VRQNYQQTHRPSEENPSSPRPSPPREEREGIPRSKVAVIFHHLGPYHEARLRAATRVVSLLPIQGSASDNTYAWDPLPPIDEFQLQTLFPGDGMQSSPSPPQEERAGERRQSQVQSQDVSAQETQNRLYLALDQTRPEVVAVPGWSSRLALAALTWCLRTGTPALMMSETTAWDETRSGVKEWIKRRIIRLCSAGLAGGNPHRDYLAALGMPKDRVFLGYDAVDNEYFAKKAEEARGQRSEVGQKHGLPDNYFLASARFIEKKNLPRLLQAYALYREKAESRKLKTDIWDLVLLGDGPLRETLNSQLSTLNLQPHVRMPGFKQYPELPVYYGLARAFIHASTTEQWGLVVNEAMASGLPVLVSNRCGCAPDLVKEGMNGFTFDPYNIEQLAGLMLKLSTFNFQLSTMGRASERIIANWGPERFAQGLKAAAECAMAVGAKKAGLLDRLLLRALSLR